MYTNVHEMSGNRYTETKVTRVSEVRIRMQTVQSITRYFAGERDTYCRTFVVCSAIDDLTPYLTLSIDTQDKMYYLE